MSSYGVSHASKKTRWSYKSMAGLYSLHRNFEPLLWASEPTIVMFFSFVYSLSSNHTWFSAPLTTWQHQTSAIFCSYLYISYVYITPIHILGAIYIYIYIKDKIRYCHRFWYNMTIILKENRLVSCYIIMFKSTNIIYFSFVV